MLDFCLLTFTLILEHIGYSIVVRYPRQVKQYVGRPTEVLHLFLLSQKCLQCCAIFWFGWRHRAEFVLRSDVTTSEIWTGIGAICVGQVLNLSVYRAIGRKGVYYGAQFGHDLPFVTTFPYNWMTHPQYLGALLTWYGAIYLVYATTVHTVFTASVCYGLFMVQTVNYWAMAKVEEVEVKSVNFF